MHVCIINYTTREHRNMEGNAMQATEEAESTRHITVRMGNRTYRSELEYTRAQAEEIHKMVVESARAARGNDRSIEPREFELVG